MESSWSSARRDPNARPSVLARGKFYGADARSEDADRRADPLPLIALMSPTFSYIRDSNGIYYSSCWVNYVQSPYSYKVLSFHEIRQ